MIYRATTLPTNEVRAFEAENFKISSIHDIDVKNESVYTHNDKIYKVVDDYISTFAIMNKPGAKYVLQRVKDTSYIIAGIKLDDTIQVLVPNLTVKEDNGVFIFE